MPRGHSGRGGGARTDRAGGGLRSAWAGGHYGAAAPRQHDSGDEGGGSDDASPSSGSEGGAFDAADEVRWEDWGVASAQILPPRRRHSP